MTLYMGIMLIQMLVLVELEQWLQYTLLMMLV